MPVYAYIRVSHIDSANSGLSPEVQKMAVLSRFDYELRKGADPCVWKWGSVGWEGTKNVGTDTTDGLFIDRAVSAFKVGISARPAGKRLDRALKGGDTVILARLDRAFRNIRDFVNTTALWQGRGVRIIFINPDVDLSTHEGKLFAGMAALWAEYESELKSERNKEIAAYQRRMGLRGPGVVPLGWREHPLDRKKRDANPKLKTPIRIIPDNEQRRYIRRMVHMHDVQGMSYRKISDRLEEERAKAENRPYRYYPEFDGKPRRDWPPAAVQDAVTKWRNGTIPPPTDEPLDPQSPYALRAAQEAQERQQAEQRREQFESASTAVNSA